MQRWAQRAAHSHPIALVWLGMMTYSTGPVMVAASSVDGPVFSMMRLVVGVLVVGLVAMLAPRSPDRALLPRRAWLWTLLAGVAFGGQQLFFMTAVKLTSVTDVMLMNTLSPVVVMVLAGPMFNERTDRSFRAWTAVAIVGAMIVTAGGASGPDGDLGGMAMAAVNVLFFSCFYLFSKAARPHVDVWPFLFVALAIATCCVAAYFLATGRSWAGATRVDWVLATGVAPRPVPWATSS